VKKMIVMGLAAASLAMATGAAQAGNVQWSIGVNLPPVGAVVSNAPAYYEPAPVYYQPAPVYVAPPPPVVYVPQPRVIYRPAPVYVPAPVVYRTAPVVYTNGYYYGQRHHHGDWQGRRDEYGNPWREGRWVPADPRRQHHDR